MFRFLEKTQLNHPGNRFGYDVDPGFGGILPTSLPMGEGYDLAFKFHYEW
jgi:hypothetical protein